jgi:hypothetical protein
MESITGYNIIKAESIDEAEKIAKSCPYIASLRVYEIMSMQSAPTKKHLFEMPLCGGAKHRAVRFIGLWPPGPEKLHSAWTTFKG